MACACGSFLEEGSQREWICSRHTEEAQEVVKRYKSQAAAGLDN